VKLDELIRVTEGARSALLDLEELDEKDLERIRSQYASLAERARADFRGEQEDSDAPEVE